MKKASLLLTFCFITLLTYGQVENQASIDDVFAEWNTPNTPGASLGIIKDGVLVYAKGYGLANMEYDIPNSPSSVFRIGSTSKQFTAACIVLLAEQGKLELDNSLNQYFPNFPEYAKRITVRHLLNHTSGIRDYLMIASLKGYSDDTYYEDNDIMKWLVRQTDLNFEPGEEFLYSNSGYWLLGQIVEEVSTMNMAEFAEKEIFNPLGMTNTHFHNDHTQIVKNRASGYIPDSDESYQISMTTLGMIGDGGIFTTINDIKKWDDAYYNSEVLNKSFWGKMTEQGLLNNGEKIDYASGLFISEYKGLKTISHGGAFVGFRAEIVRFPEQRLSIAVFANRGDANPTKKAYEVADILLKDQFKEVQKSDTKAEVKLEATTPEVEFSLEQIAGSYEIQPGAVVKMTVKDGTLNALQKWNDAAYDIVKSIGNTFEMPGQDGLSFTFSNLNDDKTQTLVVNQNGNETVCKRKEESEAINVKSEDYLGAFYSEELDVTYLLSQEGEALMIKVGSNDPIKLNATVLDQFTSGLGQVTFERKDDSVSGFSLDAGRVKNLKFKKK